MTSVVHRRAFLGAMAGGLLAAPVIVEAQQPTKYLIGFLGEDFSSKWLELLREVIPKISRVAVLLNRANPASVGYLTVLRGAAQKLGIKLQLRDVRDPDQLDGVFAAMVAERAQGLVVVVD